MTIQHKTLNHVEIKSADRGEVSAVFSTFDVRDLDGDVVLREAIDDGAEVVISGYGHTSWGGALPVGKGRIRVTESEAVMDGQFFLDTTAGRDTFAVIKELGGGQQWSYGYDVLDSGPGKFDGREVKFLKRLKVHEVSPVLVGAGVNTRTLAVKALTDRGVEPGEALRLVERTVGASAYKAAIRPHETPLVVKWFNAKAVANELPDDTPIADLRSMFAWCDPSGDPEAKGSYRFLHHEGPYGEANMRACYREILTLNTKSAIPDEDRQSVYSHLAAHLQDGDREPPELRAIGDDSPLKLQEQIITTIVANDDLGERASEVMALRATKGKSIAAASADLLEWWHESQRRTGTLLDSPQDDAAREYLRFIESQINREDLGE